MPFKTSNLCSIVLLAAFSICVISCAKKSKDSPQFEAIRPPITNEQEEFLSKQDLACEAGKFCPEYMVKIVAFEAGKHHVCTGFLTDSQTIATSTTCLPAFLRLKDQDCSNDLFFFFPKTYSNEAIERRGCRKVVKVSMIDSDNPVLWRSDLAFLSLDAPIYRRSLFPTREGMPNNGHLTMWSINKVDDYLSLVKRDICQVIHNSYFNPLSTGEYSPGVTVANCEFNKSNSGAPLIDDTGLVIGRAHV